jgi:hypothetical protein
MPVTPVVSGPNFDLPVAPSAAAVNPSIAPPKFNPGTSQALLRDPRMHYRNGRLTNAGMRDVIARGGTVAYTRPGTAESQIIGDPNALPTDEEMAVEVGDQLSLQEQLAKKKADLDRSNAEVVQLTKSLQQVQSGAVAAPPKLLPDYAALMAENEKLRKENAVLADALTEPDVPAVPVKNAASGSVAAK